MKKALIFSTAYLPLIGGAELAVSEITDRIVDWEFDLICARLDSRLSKIQKIGRVNVYRIGWGSGIDKILLPFLGFWKARQLYRSSAISHQPLFLWGLMASWGSAAAWIFKIFYPRAPFLLTLQEGDAESYIKKGRGGLINLGWHLILKKADRVQVISSYLADMARKYGYGGKIDVVPNGVDVGKFSIFNFPLGLDLGTERQFSKKDLKNKLNIKDDEKVIISVSRLAEKNGVGDIIEAMTKYPISNDQYLIKLLIIGGGLLEKNLKSRVSNLGLQDRILFLGDVPNEKVPEYLAISDVFIRPSLSEGLGNSFLEAMAAGVPVIGTPVGGIPDFLKDGETGLFCEVNNPESIAEKIKILLENDDLRKKIIENARKTVKEKYDWNKISIKMQDIFSDVARLKKIIEK